MGKRIYSSSIKKGDLVKFKSGVQKLNVENGSIQIFVKNGDYVKNRSVGIVYKTEKIRKEKERMFYIYVSEKIVKITESKFGIYLDKI